MTRLKYERLKRGWTLQTTGYKSSMQGSEISKIERRMALPYPGQRARLATLFGLDPAALLEEVAVTEDTLLDPAAEVAHGA